MEAYFDTGSRSLAFGEPRSTIVAYTVADVGPAFQRVEAACRAGAYAVGFAAYEAAPAFDPALRVHDASPGLPLVWFGLHDAPVEGPRRRAAGYACSAWRPSIDESSHHRAVDTVRDAIERGDTYQVNLTLEMQARFDGDPLGAWDDLRAVQGSGWFAYLETRDHAVVSVSPELFFCWDGSRILTRPMKGTRARSAQTERDRALAAELRGSPKDLAENVMIVDLLRNDLGKVCVAGSVDVAALFEIEAYPTVWQMTSTVTGRTRSEVGLAALFGALFPCGSITGAPKASTMGIITALEDRPRGVYCGAIGVVRPDGTAEFNVAIRTMVVERATGTARYGIGGGIVWDSEPGAEYEEALAKAAVLAATQPEFDLVETLLFDGRSVTLRDRHLDRMAASAAWFGRDFDRGHAQDLLGALSGGPQRVRLLLAGDGSARCSSTPLVASLGGAPDVSLGGAPDVSLGGAPDVSLGGALRVSVAEEPVWSGDPWLRHKTTLRAVYDRARATDPDAFDTLLWNERGELTELTIGNLVVRLDGRLVTPPLSSGLLPGTLRAELVESGQVIEAVVAFDDLDRAEALWLVNSVRGWVPITVARRNSR